LWGQLPLISNDTTVDNGRVINNDLSTGPTTEITRSITAPGGIYWFKTPLNFRYRDSIEMDFQGILGLCRPGRIQESSAVVFVYKGDVTKTGMEAAVRLGGHGYKIQGLNLARYFYGDKDSEGNPHPNEGIGLLIHGPGGSHHIEDFCAWGFDTAIKFAAGESHVECNLLENIHTYNCNITLFNEERQAISHQLESVNVFGRGNTVLKFGRLAGGRFNVDTLSIIEERLVVDYPQGNANSYRISIQNFNADANAGGWRLINHVSGPLSLYVRGQMSRVAVPAVDAIQVGPEAQLDVEIHWKGKIWPRDFKVENGEWIIK
jgi:hypothetical protein